MITPRNKTRSTGPQKLNFFNPLTIIDSFLIKFKVANREECPNRSTNNGHMAKIVKRTVCDEVTEWVCEIYVIRERLTFFKYLVFIRCCFFLKIFGNHGISAYSHSLPNLWKIRSSSHQYKLGNKFMWSKFANFKKVQNIDTYKYEA